MNLFITLLSNLFPLYIIIGLGYAAGRWLKADRQTLASVALFIFVPVVAFGFVTQIEFRPAYAILPVLIFLFQTVIAFGVLRFGRMIYPDNRANLLAMCAAMGNSGYFGLPLVMVLFDAHWTGVYVFMMLGMVMFEATVGYYIAARGQFSVRDSLIRLSRFPTIYAIILGLIFNALSLKLPEPALVYWSYFKGAYVVVGMMIIGVMLAGIGRLVFSARFIGLSFFGKFVVWPVAALVFMALDRSVFHLFEPQIHHLLLIMALVPHGANTAAFAAQFGLRPEKAATTVFLGTVFALFYIPAFLALTGVLNP